MPPTAQSVLEDLKSVQDKMPHLLELSKSLNTFNDGLPLRDSIKTDIKFVAGKFQQIKKDIEVLEKDSDPKVSQVSSQFDLVQKQITPQLQTIMGKLREAQETESKSGAPQPVQPVLMDQTLIDEQSVELSTLESEVSSIVTILHEVNDLFHQTFEELQKQRHILVEVDQHVESSLQAVKEGNTELDVAKKHQGKTTKTVLLILLILLIIVGGICLYIFVIKK